MDNRKVGRPKLADTNLKKKSLIISGIMLLVSIALLAGGLISLNILPKFNKLKGEVVCTEIPARFRPYDAETNPEGLHEYGFTDINFYNAVIMESRYDGENNSFMTYGENYCNTITEAQLSTIAYLNAGNKEINNLNGIEYLNHTFRAFNISNNNISGELDLTDFNFNTCSNGIDLSNNKLTSVKFGDAYCVEHVDLNNNELESITFGNFATADIDLSNNKLTYVDLSDVCKSIPSFWSNPSGYYNLAYNNLTAESIILPKYISTNALNLINNKISSISLVGQEELDELDLQYNPLSDIKYILKGEEIEYNPVILNSKYEQAYLSNDENIVKYENGKIKGLETGAATITLSNNSIETKNPILIDIYIFQATCGDDCDQTAMINYITEKYNMTLEEIQQELSNGDTTTNLVTQKVIIYSVESEKYDIDTAKKEIKYNGELNLEDIDLGLEGLTGVVEGDNYIIKDGETIVDTYKLVNMKKEEVKPSDKEETITKSNNITTTKNDSNNVITTIKKVATTKKVKVNRKIINTTKEETTTTTNAIINKIIKTNKGNTTTKVVEKKSNNIRWVIWPIILIILIIGYIIYKKNKNRD